MIRLVTVEALDAALVSKIRAALYQAYGLGCEVSAAGLLPRLPARGPIDARDFLNKAGCAEAIGDDKVLFLTSRPLANRALPSGEVPTPSLSLLSVGRAIVSAHGLGERDPDLLARRLSKLALHEMGRLWGLHHCLDPRCALYPPWSPPFAGNGQPQLCAFCREKSEARINLAKS